MRWTLAILTSALLSSAAMAQSLQPGWDGSLPQIALAPAIELPVAAVGPATVEHQTAATTAPDTLPVSPAPPVAAITSAPAPITPQADTRDQPQHFGRSVATQDRSARTRSASAPRARTPSPRLEAAPSYNYNTYQVRRDVGRFLPPVF